MQDMHNSSGGKLGQIKKSVDHLVMDLVVRLP